MITVVTPTIRERQDLLVECRASVVAAGLPHLIGIDRYREGPAIIRNRLARRVLTPWLVFLDDDDLLEPEYQAIVRPWLDDADVIYTDWHLSGVDWPEPESGPFSATELRVRNYIPVTTCVRVDLFRQVGGFPCDVALEDHGLWLRLLDAGARFVHVPEPAWRYRRRADSRTGS